MNSKLKQLSKKVKKMPFLLRWGLGISLIIGGVFWILPILGLWMIPLGLLILAQDFKFARRGYLSIITWFRRFRDRNKDRNKSA